MIKYYAGTVFNANTDALVNTVNCTGVMGAGLALEFMLRYPEMFADYVAKCKNKQLKVGEVDYYSDQRNTIISFPTKWHFKYPSNLLWIEQGLQSFSNTYRNHDVKSVAFPKLGTSRGGLNWNDVKLLMEKHLAPLDIEVTICLDQLNFAEGVEMKMLESLEAENLNYLHKIVRLSDKQIKNIQDRKPFSRFREIIDVESVGSKTYCDLYRYYYIKAVENPPEPLKLF